MPPFLPRKRLRSPSPEAGPSGTSARSKVKSSLASRRATLFDDLDAGTSKKRSSEDAQAILKKLVVTDKESSLSSLSEDEFEDIAGATRQKRASDSDEDDEDIEFEDVETHIEPRPSGSNPSGDLELTLKKDARVSISNPLGSRKGPSKIERQIRIATHQVHVQLLMFHNAIRNAWLCNKELHKILLKQIPPGIEKEIQRWRRDSGLEPREEASLKGKSKANGKNSKGKGPDLRGQRDWGGDAAKLAAGEVNMSRGDPLVRVLSVLVNYWRQRFRIRAPSLRKLGYMSLGRLDEEIKSFEKDKHDPPRHGERIRNLEEFKDHAKTMEGSRDVGAQLFTALLRGIGLEARLVANLQPVGFGWSQYEEASETNPRNLKKTSPPKYSENSSEQGEERISSEEEKPASKRPRRPNTGSSKLVKASRPRSLPGNKEAPINLSDSDRSRTESDEESVIDVTPTFRRSLPSLPYDKDLVTPNYWSEVLSPVTNTYTSVDPIVLHLQANKPDFFEKFLPPAKSERARHVTCYVIGHSSDGTAKDVTTRYLKGRMWPGRTKGYRLPPEKIPIHDRRGKVVRYETYDWFKRVMTGYARGAKQCPRTEIDDHEEATVLKPMKREKKVVEEGKETLQHYKTSSKYVLERHLKREEALIVAARHVKMFSVKGKGGQIMDEKVFLRKDVVTCKSMETWHKEGRAPMPGEEPLKRVPYRAATTNRRRELAEAEHASGEKVLQGLYSRDQTDWIIPPPIENGIIPKNAFGNIDLYVDSMLPEGAVHIPMRGTVRICKRLGIDYAEAVTGFEFGHRMAVPIITGVVVAAEHYHALMDEWQKEDIERVRKEDEKRRKAVLNMWRRMLMGRRIVERVREEYGNSADHEVDALNPWTNKKKTDEDNQHVEAQRGIIAQRDENNAGGFFPEGYDEEGLDDARHTPGFFPVAHQDGEDHANSFTIEDHDEESTKISIGQVYPTPLSLKSNVKPGSVNTSDENEEQYTPELVPNAAVRKPIRATTSKNTLTSNSITRTPAKRRASQRKMPVSKKAGKRRSTVNDAEDGEDDEILLSDLQPQNQDSNSEHGPLSSKKPLKKAPNGRTSRAFATNKASPRTAPKRVAAKKSATALRSHYFKISSDDDDDDADDGYG